MEQLFTCLSFSPRAITALVEIPRSPVAQCFKPSSPATNFTARQYLFDRTKAEIKRAMGKPSSMGKTENDAIAPFSADISSNRGYLNYQRTLEQLLCKREDDNGHVGGSEHPRQTGDRHRLR